MFTALKHSVLNLELWLWQNKENRDNQSYPIKQNKKKKDS